MVTFEQVWAAEFAPQVAAARRVQTERRTEAFLDITLTVCGEELRQMTPADLLHLDALENPYVCGAPLADITPLDSAAFLWQLAALNDHTPSFANLWRRSRFLRRIAATPADTQLTAILAYTGRIFADFPGSSESSPSPESSAFAPESKTYFLAPLLVEVASDIGHLDPMSGQLLAHTPLPRLAQYQRTLRERTSPEKDYTELDSLRNRCMDRVNQLNAATRQSPIISLAGQSGPPDVPPDTGSVATDSIPLPLSAKSAPSAVKNSDLSAPS
jgi:hypothetical protein